MTGRLAEGLSFEWRAERHLEELLHRLVDQAGDPEQAARIGELAASARARSARLERRLEALCRPPRLAPLPQPFDRLDEGLETALALTRAAADRYAALAELARRLADPESAFSCELNRIAAEEAAIVLDGMLAAAVELAIQEGALGA